MENIYCILDMCGTKTQFLNLFYGTIGFFSILGILIFIDERKTKINNQGYKTKNDILKNFHLPKLMIGKIDKISKNKSRRMEKKFVDEVITPMIINCLNKKNKN